MFISYCDFSLKHKWSLFNSIDIPELKFYSQVSTVSSLHDSYIHGSLKKLKL